MRGSSPPLPKKVDACQLFLFGLAAAILAVSTIAPAFASAKILAGKVILLDPGHAVLSESGAMINPGARARRGVWERDVALKVASKIVPLVEEQGAKVFLTRTTDNPWRYSPRKSADNRARAILANTLRADAYVRIHCDWNRSRKFKGFTTYYYRWGSRDLAKALRDALVKAVPDHRDNGLHRRSFVSVTARMPSVLVELGVLSFKPEAKDLAKDEFQNRLAQGLAKGIVDYLKED